MVNPKAGEELWTLDLADHFLVEYAMGGNTLYAFIGSIIYSFLMSSFSTN